MRSTGNAWKLLRVHIAGMVEVVASSHLQTIPANVRLALRLLALLQLLLILPKVDFGTTNHQVGHLLQADLGTMRLHVLPVGSGELDRTHARVDLLPHGETCSTSGRERHNLLTGRHRCQQVELHHEVGRCSGQGSLQRCALGGSEQPPQSRKRLGNEL